MGLTVSCTVVFEQSSTFLNIFKDMPNKPGQDDEYSVSFKHKAC